MTPLQFYREWGRRATHGPLAWAQVISLLAALGWGAVRWSVPAVGDWTFDPVWAISAIAFLVLLVWAWTSAPLSMYRDLESQHENGVQELSSQIRELQREIQSLTDRESLKRSAQEQHDRQCDCLSDVLTEATTLFRTGAPTVQEATEWSQRYDEWVPDATERLKSEVTNTAAKRFNVITGNFQKEVESQRRHQNGKHFERLVELRERIANLMSLLEQQGITPPSMQD